MSKESPIKMLLDAISAASENDSEMKPPQFTLEELIAMRNKPREPLQPGQRVRWRCEQLRTFNLPVQGGEMYVVDVLAVPERDRSEGCGNPYFAMPLDVRVATLRKDGDYIEFLVEGSRIEIVEVDLFA